MADGITIKVPDMGKWKKVFDSIEEDATKDMISLVRDTAAWTLKYLQKTTPKGKGAPRFGRHIGTMWFSKELGKGSHRGRYLGFSVVIDHPFNKPGTMREVNPVPGNRPREIVVNDGKRSILSDLEYGTAPHTVDAFYYPSGRGNGKRAHTLHWKGYRGKDFFRLTTHPRGITKTVGFIRRSASFGQRLFEQGATQLLNLLNARIAYIPGMSGT